MMTPLSDTDLANLRRHWHDLLGPFAVPTAAGDAAFAELVRAYSDPARHYHNLGHLRDILDAVRSLLGHVHDPAAVQLAAWFHDVVYDPRANDNEERSADQAEVVLRRLGLPEQTITAVRRLILQTKTHEADDPDGWALLDADLAILGAAPDRYAAYAAAIRQEYAWVPDDAYRAGRSRVLQQFLQRKRLFRTDTFFSALEVRARTNLTQELAVLSQPGAPAGTTPAGTPGSSTFS
jgi:predicted metal-dependent HD superfamily phosphohydrolase